MGVIAERVAAARRDENPFVIGPMRSGWAVMGDEQLLTGYALLLADPVVGSLNALHGEARTQFLEDMAALGDAVLAATGARRINYAIYGNLVPELHAHVIPRSDNEPEKFRTAPYWLYPSAEREASPFDARQHEPLQKAIRDLLQIRGLISGKWTDLSLNLRRPTC